MTYTSQLCCDKNNGWQNGLISPTLFSEWQKIMANKVTFVGFSETIAPIALPLDPLQQLTADVREMTCNMDEEKINNIELRN